MYPCLTSAHAFRSRLCIIVERIMKMSSQQVSLFLELKKSLRLKIYSYVLRASQITGNSVNTVIALQLVNRQVNAEVGSVIALECTFWFGNPQSLLRFAATTPDARKDSIRLVELALFEKLPLFVLVAHFPSQHDSTGALWHRGDDFMKSLLEDWLLSLKALSTGLHYICLNMSHSESVSLQFKLVQAQLASIMTYVTSLTEAGDITLDVVNWRMTGWTTKELNISLELDLGKGWDSTCNISLLVTWRLIHSKGSL